MTENPFLPGRDVAMRVAVFVALVFLGGILSGMLPVEGSLPRSVLYTFFAGALANAVSVRIFERGQLADFGLGTTAPRQNGIESQDIHRQRAPGRDLMMGLACGAGAAAVVIAALLAFGWDKFEPTPGSGQTMQAGSALAAVALLLFGAVGEELMFHGYAFQLLLRQLGVFATILPTAVIFGIEHLGNQGSTLVGIVNTVIWGALLGYACYRTGALWMPIGMHFGWNVLLPLAGANLSGFTIRVVGYALSPNVEGFRSGGAYGPEGSVLTTAAGAALFWLVTTLTTEPVGRGQEGEIA